MRFLPLVAAAALCVAGCDVRVGENGVSLDVSHPKAVDEWVRTYTVSPGGRVEIVNENGGIAVEAATGPAVEVRVARDVRASSDEAARALIQRLQMVEEVAPDRVKIEGRLDGDKGGSGSRTRVSLEYRLRVPPGLHVSLRTQNGNIALENVDGQITAQTVNGGVVGHGLAGALAATTVNGGLQIGMGTVTGDVTLTSVNGGVRLTLPREVRARLDATVVNGGVSVDDTLGLQAGDSSRSRVSGTLNGGGPAITLQTTNGGVRVAAGNAEVAGPHLRRY